MLTQNQCLIVYFQGILSVIQAREAPGPYIKGRSEGHLWSSFIFQKLRGNTSSKQLSGRQAFLESFWKKYRHLFINSGRWQRTWGVFSSAWEEKSGNRGRCGMTLLALFGCGNPTAFGFDVMNLCLNWVLCESGLLRECSGQRSVQNHRCSLYSMMLFLHWLLGKNKSRLCKYFIVFPTVSLIHWK